MKGKQSHPGMKSMSKATSVCWTKMWLRTCKVLNLPSTTFHGTHGGKSVHYKMAVLAVNWYVQYDHSPLVIRREAQKLKMLFQPGTEKNQVYTWIFDPGMKFCPGAEDRDEIVQRWTNFTPGSRKHQKPNDQSPRWNSSRDETRPAWDEFSHVNST